MNADKFALCFIKSDRCAHRSTGMTRVIINIYLNKKRKTFSVTSYWHFKAACLLHFAVDNNGEIVWWDKKGHCTMKIEIINCNLNNIVVHIADHLEWIVKLQSSIGTQRFFLLLHLSLVFLNFINRSIRNSFYESNNEMRIKKEK